MMIEFLSSLRRKMAELGTLDSGDCAECSGPPPMFRLPPPPRPPFLNEGTVCSEAPMAELEDCGTIPLIDVSYHNTPSLQNTALMITCAVVLLLTTTIVFVVFWKFVARTCLNTVGFSRIWQCLPTCCHLSAEGPAASLIHAPLKEPNDTTRRGFTNQRSHPHHYRRYAVQHVDAPSHPGHIQPPLPSEHERMHNGRSAAPNLVSNSDSISRNKSPGRSPVGTEHVIMLLSVAAQLTNKKPRFL